MARTPSSRGDSQVDPFNAGEPIMPWDDSAAAHEECDLADGTGYDAPSPDRTDARRKRAERRAAADARRAARRRTAAGGGQSNRAEAAEDGSWAGDGVAREEPPQEGGAVDAATADSALAAADGSKKQRRIIVTVVLVAVAVELILGLVSCAGSAVDTVADALFSSDEDALSTGSLDEASNSSEELDEDEQTCIAAVQGVLDGLSENEEARGLVIGDFEDLLESSTGFTAAELGLSSEEFADWYFDAFWYEIDSAFAWSDGSGTVYFDYAYISYSASSDFAGAVNDYLASAGAETGSALTAEQQAGVLSLYEEFLAENDIWESAFGSLGLTYSSGAWSVDASNLSEELEWILDLY